MIVIVFQEDKDMIHILETLEKKGSSSVMKPIFLWSM